MIGAEIIPIVILQGLVGVADGDIPVSRVTCHLAHLEKQFEIHHIIYNDRAFPTSFGLPTVVYDIPGLKDAGCRAETGGKGIGSVDKNLVIARDILQAQAVTVTVIDHKAYVVMPGEVLDFVQDLSVLLSLEGILLLTGEFVHIPESACEESAYPVVCRDEFDLSVLIGGRDSQSIALFTGGD